MHAKEFFPPVATAIAAAIAGSLLLGSASAADLSIGPSDAVSDLALPGAGGLLDKANNPLLPWEVLVDNSGDGMPFYWVAAGADLSTSADNQSITYQFLGSQARYAITFNASDQTFVHSSSGSDTPDLTARTDITESTSLADLLSFNFQLGGDSICNANGKVANGSNRRPGIRITKDGTSGSAECRTNKPQFIAAYVQDIGDGTWELTDTPTNSVLILLDDGGPGPTAGLVSPDSDYNDMLILVTAEDGES